MKRTCFYTFLLAFTLAASSAYAGKSQKIHIADHYALCGDATPTDCLLYRAKDKDPWQNLTQQIEGFNYEEGYNYRLKVATAVDGKFILKRVLQKKRSNYKPEERLDQKQWFLYMLHDDSSYLKLGDTTRIYMKINVAEQSVSGRAMCNNFMGKMSIEGSSLTFGHFAMTKMYCDGDFLEQIIMDMFSRMKTFRVAGNTLTLRGDGNYLMLFKTPLKW